MNMYGYDGSKAIDTRDAIENAIVALRATGDTSGAIDTLRMMLLQSYDAPDAKMLCEHCDIIIFG